MRDAAISAQLGMKWDDHAKESPELAFDSRDWKIGYCFGFSLEGPYTLVIYHVT